MFEASLYVARRERLMNDVGSGLIVLLGHGEPPKNYQANTYAFRQDSTFLYFFGLDQPDLAAVLDADDRRVTVFGDDLTVDQIVWTGFQPTVAERAARAGVADTAPMAKLSEAVSVAIRKGRRVHFLPQYRAENALWLERLTGIRAEWVNEHRSLPLVMAVIEQRAHKGAEELAELETAIATTRDMHVLAMRMSRPGVYEREVAGAIEGLALSQGVPVAFPVIFSIHGETLHNHYHGNRMEAGQMAVNDSGAESPLGYAADITRTIPIGGRFTGIQRDLYLAVLDAEKKAIEAVKPGVPYKEVHLLASRILAGAMKDLGCMKGDLDAAVAAGAHALFFQCGVGHMLGLDVHDMEALGEQYVGYDETVARSTQFGLKSLRLARKLEPGFVLTVEPGIYIIPQLIDRWRAEGRFTEFIDYDAVAKLQGFGGIRIEDDVVVTDGGCKVLGPPIPKEIDDVEELARG
ncbi:MAG: aminopeptidase P family protein [Vicinamibacterales bacterium]